MEVVNEGTSFIAFLDDEPTLLPEGPEEITAYDLHFRASHEDHICLRCGKQAEVALVAKTKIGFRWLDLCHNCYTWLTTQLAEAQVEIEEKGFE